MASWLLISGAPRDGTEIILGEPKVTWSGYWENTPNHWDEIGWQAEDARQGHFMHRHPEEPTHFQLLPEPPMPSMPPKCTDCGINPSDPPSELCPGCEAYREHTA